MQSTIRIACTLALLLPLRLQAECDPNQEDSTQGGQEPCVQRETRQLETMTIFGVAQDPRDVAGGASEISAADLEAFATTDVVRALRRVPGASLQTEDGYGLRPNISIRGTPSERSSRITLLEDNILIAPATYAAPSAYYFPTFGRIHSVEVLKGPAGISQGPYTMGGAVNLVSTPIPDRARGLLRLEAGTDSTWRAHAWYGDAGSRAGWLVETHQWDSDGYQHIDRSNGRTGLDKEDYLAKLSFSSAPAAPVPQRLEVKLQTSMEDSEQSYLGLSDADFHSDPLRRYGLSDLDNIHVTHDQVVLSWTVEPTENLGLFLTGYRNETARAWYKTEGIDFNGSDAPETFRSASWASVIEAVNLGAGLAGLDSAQLQAILDGADTLPGSIQLRNNSREYDAQGVQGGGTFSFDRKSAAHELKFGFRWHEDEEDRLQRNDTYQQLDGMLALSQLGLQGNAGNRIQSATAWSLFVQDRIEFDRWVLTPGLRYENIEQRRVEFGADPSGPSGRTAADISGTRSNREDFWIPGLGALLRINEQWNWVAGVHKGFSAPGNKNGIKAETSVNYEAGFRYFAGPLGVEAMAFYQDYRNLQGVCTASSGSNCEIGDAFNGNAVSVPGLEFLLTHDLAHGRRFAVPLQLSYTWMDAQFDSDIADSEFFGDVSNGDPVPYIPDHQLFVSLGLESGPWSTYLSGTYVDSVCTRASCGAFEQTESSLTVDLGAHYRLSKALELYAVMENLTRELDIVGRQPYGARPGKDRSWLLGARLAF